MSTVFAATLTDFTSARITSVFEVAQDAPDRRGDIRGRKRRGRNFVKERLKKMVIGPVDNGDADRFVAELFRRFKATKAGSHDHDMRFFRESTLHGRNFLC